VDDVNIGNVYRFSKKNDSVVVQHPQLDFSSNESTLIHLLKFENMSKIFFVNKIIMVEGETDQYFFEYYLKFLHTLPEWKDKITDYEIININGK
jgi:predicted ATP-dependent endonuclease of OLD family